MAQNRTEYDRIINDLFFKAGKEIKCDKCGTINPPSSHYCRHCGEALSSLYSYSEYSLFSSGEYTVVLKSKYDSLKRRHDSLMKTVASLKKEVDNYLPNVIGLRVA